MSYPFEILRINKKIRKALLEKDIENLDGYKAKFSAVVEVMRDIAASDKIMWEIDTSKLEEVIDIKYSLGEVPDPGFPGKHWSFCRPTNEFDKRLADVEKVVEG